MSNFRIADMDAVSDTGVADEGKHTVTATNFEATKSKASGNPMMKMELTVDSGQSAGHKLVENIVFNATGQIGERKLKAFCLAAGYKWRVKDDLKSFAAQFPKNELRAGVIVTHRYSIKVGDKWETVEHDKYEAWEGKRNIMAQVEEYFEAETPPDLVFGDQAEEETFEPDDELPF